MSAGEAGFFPRLVDERLIFPDLTGTNVEEALEEMSAGLVRAGVVSDADDLARRLIEREHMGSTGLGGGLAIPHCKVRELSDVVLAVGLSRAGVDFRAPDGAPVTLIFLVLSPSEAPALHLQALARISRVIRMPGIADGLRGARTGAEVASILKDAERQLAVPV
jgi:mannitol/fructose-specific phosphotransferase system IIA component (Ntr-type)